MAGFDDPAFYGDRWAARGIRVEGVDASAAMVERLRAKPGGESIPVTIGDMAQVPVSGR